MTKKRFYRILSIVLVSFLVILAFIIPNFSTKTADEFSIIGVWEFVELRIDNIAKHPLIHLENKVDIFYENGRFNDFPQDSKQIKEKKKKNYHYQNHTITVLNSDGSTHFSYHVTKTDSQNMIFHIRDGVEAHFRKISNTPVDIPAFKRRNIPIQHIKTEGQGIGYVKVAGRDDIQQQRVNLLKL